MDQNGIKFEIERLTDARLAAIIDSSFDAIVSKDLNSVITSWNTAAERVFGYTAEEAVGSSILMLIPPERHADEVEIIRRIRNGERVESFETVRLRKDGTPIHVSLTISPIRDAEGRIVGASKIARDISATKESEQRINLLMKEVNHRVKNQFAVILSMIRASAKSEPDYESFKHQITERIMGLARSHDLLVDADWRGMGLFVLIEEHLKPFGQENKVSLSGPMIDLSINSVQHLGMAFHELATNSAKYGALAEEGGTISVSWDIRRGEAGEAVLWLNWDESFTPRAHAGERQAGFGTAVLQSVTPRALMGQATLEHLPAGFRWTLTASMDTVVPKPD